MRSQHLVLAGVLAAGLFVIGAPALEAQIPNAVGGEGMGWMLRNLRPSGQPVIPIFDGWYENEDGTYNLCFGYHNLNTEQALDIPLGPDNFIEPDSLDGAQPTHFLVVPRRDRRYFCVFSVHVSDFGDDDVTWSLRIDDRTYSVPTTRSEHYRIDELELPSRGLTAPAVRFVEPPGKEIRGRDGLMAGTVTTTAGQPVTLTISLTHPRGDPLGRQRVVWAKHQGPGDVTFSRSEFQIEEPENDVVDITTTATFSVPGVYVLRAQAVDWNRGSSLGNQCCWTNGFLEVTVRE